MRVLESGLPPLGGSAAPPNTLVKRLMKVLLPHPESAARPITTVFSPDTEHMTTDPLLPLLEQKVEGGLEQNWEASDRDDDLWRPVVGAGQAMFYLLSLYVAVEERDWNGGPATARMGFSGR